MTLVKQEPSWANLKKIGSYMRIFTVYIGTNLNGYKETHVSTSERFME